MVFGHTVMRGEVFGQANYQGRAAFTEHFPNLAPKSFEWVQCAHFTWGTLGSSNHISLTQNQHCYHPVVAISIWPGNFVQQALTGDPALEPALTCTRWAHSVGRTLSNLALGVRSIPQMLRCF